MRNSALLLVALATPGSGGLGCTSNRDPGSAESSVSVTVAPFELPLMTDACYALSVFGTAAIEEMNATSLVWTQPSLCASDHGAEGGIRFTGVCDAQAGGFDDSGTALDPDHNNTIMLVLNDIYTAGDWDGDGVALSPGRDYINPCPAAAAGEDNGCILKVPCTANQDEKVLFNLTVMRDAQLGFFDTVVKFQDVFCAAKLDCVDDDNQTLAYLHDPDATPPGDGPTVVLGFACLGGGSADDNATRVFMYLDDLVITCTDGTATRTATVDPSGGPGNLGSDHLMQSGAPNVLFGAAVHTGEGFQGAHYWNVLLGLNLPGGSDENCTLHTTGTVSETALDDNTTPTLTRYPFINWTVDLTEDGDRTCTRHPLNGADGGVATDYTGLETAESFDNLLVVGGACPCWDAADIGVLVTNMLEGTGAYQWNYQYSAEEPDVYDYFQLGNESGYIGVGAGHLAWSVGSEFGAEDDATGSFCVEANVSVAGQPSWMQPITAEEEAACRADIATWMDNPCATANGGCPEAMPICIYDGPAERRCGDCTTDSECAAGRVCDTDANSCVECLNNGDCPAATPICETPAHTCAARALTSISIFPADAVLEMGNTYFATTTYVATGHFNDGSTLSPLPGVAWTSSDPGIASMTGAIATTVGGGTVTITASAEGVSGQTSLTVIDLRFEVCATSADCINPARPHCDLAALECVECLSDTDCSGLEVCEDGRCDEVYLSAATSWDLDSEFSTSADPNRVWRYGWTQTLGAPFHFGALVPVSGSVMGWAGSAGGPYPTVFHNSTSSQVFGFIPPGVVSLHPGPGNERGVVRWRAPASGDYLVVANFTRLHYGATDSTVLVNSVPVFGPIATATPTLYSATLTLTQGDALDFVVGFGIGAGNDFQGDSTGLEVDITAL